MIATRSAARRVGKTRLKRASAEVMGYLQPMVRPPAPHTLSDDKLVQAARARRIAVARARTDRRGLRAMWCRRILA
jgi:hypothetical protein